MQGHRSLRRRDLVSHCTKECLELQRMNTQGTVGPEPESCVTQEMRLGCSELILKPEQTLQGVYLNHTGCPSCISTLLLTECHNFLTRMIGMSGKSFMNRAQ